MERDEVTTTVSVLGAREAWRFACLAVIALSGVAFLVASIVDVAAMAIIGTLVCSGVVWVPLLFAWNRSQKLDADPHMLAARAGSDGLFVDGKLALPRSMIRAAYVSPSWPNGAYVRIERKGAFPAELWTADAMDARAIVRSLSLDARRVVGTFAGRSPARGTIWVVLQLFALFAVLLFSLEASAAWPFPAAMLACFLLLAASSRIEVGTDGVRVSWLGVQTRFVRIEEIASVEQHPGVVRLVTSRGAVDLDLASGSSSAVVGLQVSMLAERIRDAMRRAGTLDVDTSLLERADVDELRALGAGQGYRASLQREDLLYVISDARKPPRVRIAASIALGELEGDERERLRIAADASSFPDLKEALAAVADGDEETVRARLRRLDR
jgi:hypothetical protein